MSAYQSASHGVIPVNTRRRNGTSVPSRPARTEAPQGITVRIIPRSENGGPRARIVAMLADGMEIEVTRTMVAAIAHALWEKRGEDHLTNWLDAEAVLNELMGVKASPIALKARAGRGTTVKDDDDELRPAALLPRRARTRRI